MSTAGESNNGVHSAAGDGQGNGTHDLDIIERLLRSVNRLIEEVFELREEKKNLQLEIASLNFKYQSLRDEVLSAQNRERRLKSASEAIPAEFQSFVIPHEEKLLLRQRILETLEKINAELQRL